MIVYKLVQPSAVWIGVAKDKESIQTDEIIFSTITDIW